MNKNVKIFVSSLIITIAVVLLIGNVYAEHAGGNINPNNLASESHAWNDVIGWIDFDNGTVTVTDTKLTGYADSVGAGVSSAGVGEIAFDCATTPLGPACAAQGGFDWGVSHDGNGNLSGWGWNDNIGWISFSGTGPDYQVIIDTTTGDFSGWAWNDIIGWISFNCSSSGGCPPLELVNYKVKTSWRPPPVGPPPANGGGPGGFDSDTFMISSIFDTQVAQGSAFNTIMWLGSLNGGRVGFQLASSNDVNGPWTDSDFIGEDGTSQSVYEPVNQGVQYQIPRLHHNNQRYIRYKAFFVWTAMDSPRIDDVIIGYSP